MPKPSILLSLLDKGRLEKVLRILRKQSPRLDEEDYAHITQLSSRLSRINKERIDGTIGADDYNLEWNRISLSLISLIQEGDPDLYESLFIKEDQKRNRIINYTMYLLLCIIPFTMRFFFPPDTRFVHDEPVIQDNIIKFNFFQFNAKSNYKTCDFEFSIYDPAREKFQIIRPAPVSFFPDELKFPERSSLGTRLEEVLYNAEMEFNLTNLETFGWMIKIKSKTNEPITKGDFWFKLKTRKPDALCSRQIQPVDYLNIYPFTLPACIALLGSILYTFFQFLIKKII